MFKSVVGLETTVLFKDVSNHVKMIPDLMGESSRPSAMSLGFHQKVFLSFTSSFCIFKDFAICVLLVVESKVE